LGVLAVALYGLCLWSYTVAVFTDPGSPIEVDNGYSYLPQYIPTHTTLQVKNDGRARYCQKCSYAKPDRTHHCSICRRCILKMDHHCPWLGNCIGFGNYKAFVLFLVYLSTFCAESCIMAVASVVYWVKYITPVPPSPFGLRVVC
jgi:palmitoyltransferase ZDHHC2/15/20